MSRVRHRNRRGALHRVKGICEICGGGGEFGGNVHYSFRVSRLVVPCVGVCFGFESDGEQGIVMRVYYLCYLISISKFHIIF